MAAALLRPELPVIARVTSRAIAERMQAFGSPATVNPFDRFGDHLRLALRAPASYQLLTWLESGPGAALPERGSPPRSGRWVVCGYGRLGRELTSDLRAEGLEVTVIEPHPTDVDDADLLVGDGSDPWVLAQADLDRAVGLVAGTDNDTTNLSLVAAARRINPAPVPRRPAEPAGQRAAVRRHGRRRAARAHRGGRARGLRAAVHAAAVAVPAGDAGAGRRLGGRLVDRLTGLCGTHLQALWKVRLTPQEAPALGAWLASGEARLGDLLRNPEDRDEPLHAIVLLVHARPARPSSRPDDDFVLQPGDELLLAGWAGRAPGARHRSCSSTPSASTWSPAAGCRRAGSGAG